MKTFNKIELITIIALVAMANANQNTISIENAPKTHTESIIDSTTETINKPAPQLKPAPKNQPVNRGKNKCFSRANNSIK